MSASPSLASCRRTDYGLVGLWSESTGPIFALGGDVLALAHTNGVEGVQRGCKIGREQ